MGFLRDLAKNVVDTATSPVPVILSGVGAGAGTLLSDKEGTKDKLKTGLATGAGATAGVVFPAVYNTIVDKIMTPSETKAEAILRRLEDKRDVWVDHLWDSYGKDRSGYTSRVNAPLFEQAQLVPIRRKAVAKVQRILDKVKAKHSKLDKVLFPLGVASMAAGGYTGYKYMED